MRKFVLHIVLFLFLLGCSDNTDDCFSSSGTEISKSVKLSDFSKIMVYEGISLEIRQGMENTLQVNYGNNLIDNISTTIIDGVLHVKNSSCTIFSHTKPAKIILTAVEISEIRNASQFSVTNKETLKYNSITLLSEDFYVKTVNVGDFNLNVDTNNLNIISNNVSNFTIKGKTNNLSVGFYAGEGKFNGKELVAQNVDVFHRGINSMTVYPVQKLTGEIRSVGDLISVNRPVSVDVEAFYTGKLVFK